MKVLSITNPLTGEQTHLVHGDRVALVFGLRAEVMPLLLDLLDRHELRRAHLLHARASEAEASQRMAGSMGWSWAGPAPGWSTPGAVFRVGERVVELVPEAPDSGLALSAQVARLRLRVGGIRVVVYPLPGRPGHVVYRVGRLLFTGLCEEVDLRGLPLPPEVVVHRSCARVAAGPLLVSEEEEHVPIEQWGGFE